MAKPAFKLHFDLLLLDIIGSAFLGLGLAKRFADVDLLPSAIRFDEAGWVMIGLGVLLMLPFLLNLLGQVRASVEGKRL